MAVHVEVLKDPTWSSRSAHAWQVPCEQGIAANGLVSHRRSHYAGHAEWLTLFGVGHPTYQRACTAHVQSGRPVACWDVGYFAKCADKQLTYYRVSLDSSHPTHADIERTPSDPSRWERLGIELKELADPEGPVLVIGMGVKSRVHLNDNNWETRALQKAVARFPRRRIIYRPKLSKSIHDDGVGWPDRSEEPSINEALRGVSLVICRHSNVALDACIAGVPVECEAGAAHWLYHRIAAPTVQQRLDLLHRVCWWQWQLGEMAEAWQFLLRMRNGR